MTTVQSGDGLRVAVIGAGITGLTLALGLQARGIHFTVYERAPALHEVGAGIGISPNAERALAGLNPAALAAFKRVAMPNGEDYFQWIDGYRSGELMYKLWLGEGLFQGCRRADFVEELGKAVEPEHIHFEKEVREVEEQEDGTLIIQFRDGSTASADVVVGCDGIRSRVRQTVLGPENPASRPGYSHKFCFRALVSMEKAKEAIGPDRALTRFMYNGPSAHVITYPVANGTLLNVLAVISDPNPWAGEADGRHTAVGKKSEAIEAFAGWHPAVRAIVDLLPDELDKWAVFDALAHPASTYFRGGVCLAGDAAHAAGPHLGAGAAFGIEDAFALSTALETADGAVKRGGVSGKRACGAALSAYNDLRYERTQWLVKETREACALFQWENPEVGSDAERFGKEITWRFHKIWHYDLDGMVREIREKIQDISRVS